MSPNINVKPQNENRKREPGVTLGSARLALGLKRPSRVFRPSASTAENLRFFFFRGRRKSFFSAVRGELCASVGIFARALTPRPPPRDHGDVMEKSRNVTDRDGRGGRGGILHRPPSLLCSSLLLRLFVQSRQRQRQKMRKAFCAGEARWRRRGRETGLP